MVRIFLLVNLLFLIGCSHHPIQPYLDELHAKFTPISDIEQYGITDYWAISYTGDCEDFALVAKEELGQGEVRITKTPSGQTHAVLELEDGYLIDILYPFPITRSFAGYEWWVDSPTPPNNVEDFREVSEIEKVKTYWGVYEPSI